MAAIILDPVKLQPGGMLLIGNVASDKVEEVPTYTCGHCNRMVACHPLRKRERHRCKQCAARICDYCHALRECHVFDADVERAYSDLGAQPWMLRHYGQPVDRIFLPDGTEKLVLRRDHNLSLTERTRYRRP